MPNERVIEIPWALMQLPQSGVILDVGSCETTYLDSILQRDRLLHCIDAVDCRDHIPEGAVYFHQNLIGNTLPRHYYDAVLVLSTIEHIGLPHYAIEPFGHGDELALAEIYHLLKPGGKAIFTVPGGFSKFTLWYRQYSPRDLERLFHGWHVEYAYWGFDGEKYVPIQAGEVERHDYREAGRPDQGAGAVIGIVATI